MYRKKGRWRQKKRENGNIEAGIKLRKRKIFLVAKGKEKFQKGIQLSLMKEKCIHPWKFLDWKKKEPCKWMRNMVLSIIFAVYLLPIELGVFLILIFLTKGTNTTKNYTPED